MSAFAVRSFGEFPSIHDLPVPAADGALLSRVRFAGVNPLDGKLLERLTAASAYPFVMQDARSCRSGRHQRTDRPDRIGRISCDSRGQRS